MFCQCCPFFSSRRLSNARVRAHQTRRGVQRRASCLFSLWWEIPCPFAESLCPKDPERQSWFDEIYGEDFLGGMGLNLMHWTLHSLFPGFCHILSYPVQSLSLRSTIGQVCAQAHRTNLGMSLMDGTDQCRSGTCARSGGERKALICSDILIGQIQMNQVSLCLRNGFWSLSSVWRQAVLMDPLTCWWHLLLK